MELLRSILLQSHSKDKTNFKLAKVIEDKFSYRSTSNHQIYLKSHEPLTMRRYVGHLTPPIRRYLRQYAQLSIRLRHPAPSELGRNWIIFIGPSPSEV